MIHGLKLAFTGEEIIRSLDDIEQLRASIHFKHDEIDGKVEVKGEIKWQEPAEVVEQEIRELEHRVRTLTLYKNRLLPSETYLLGRRALKLAGLLPAAPASEMQIDDDSEIRWVTRACD